MGACSLTMHTGRIFHKWEHDRSTASPRHQALSRIQPPRPSPRAIFGHTNPCCHPSLPHLCSSNPPTSAFPSASTAPQTSDLTSIPTLGARPSYVVGCLDFGSLPFHAAASHPPAHRQTSFWYSSYTYTLNHSHKSTCTPADIRNKSLHRYARTKDR